MDSFWRIGGYKTAERVSYSQSVFAAMHKRGLCLGTNRDFRRKRRQKCDFLRSKVVDIDASLWQPLGLFDIRSPAGSTIALTSQGLLGLLCQSCTDQQH